MFVLTTRSVDLPVGVKMEILSTQNTTPAEIHQFIQRNRERFENATDTIHMTEQQFEYMLDFTTENNVIATTVDTDPFLAMYRLDKNGQLVGWVSLSNLIMPNLVTPYVSYLLDASVEGQGVMKSALQHLLPACVTVHGIRSLQAYVHHTNQRSAGLLRSVGFEKTTRTKTVYMPQVKTLEIYEVKLG